MSVSYEERKRIADELYAKPPKADQPGQRFPRGTRVKVGQMPGYMRHFPGGSALGLFCRKFGMASL